MAASKAAMNKKIRQEALREQLSKQKHIEQVVKNINKMEKLKVDVDGGKDREINYKDLQLNQFELQKLKTANEQRFKLINKYLPDLKQSDITIAGEDGAPIQIQEITRTIVDPKHSDS